MVRDAERRGVALIIVLGVLGLISTLSIAFVTLCQLERKASQQRRNATQALFLARSGLEDILARLSAGQDPSSMVNRYVGEDWNASGALDGLEIMEEVFHAGVLDREECPVQLSLRPSFFSRDASGRPRLAFLDGRRRGYTGRLSQAEGFYCIKLENESGKINVNGGFLDSVDRDSDGIPDHRDTTVLGPVPPAGVPAAARLDRGWNAQLTRILNVLGSQGEVGIPTLGTDVVANRPRGGWTSIAQLQASVLPPGSTLDLSPHLTVRSWTDERVVHPNGYAAQTPGFFRDPPSAVKMRRAALALEEGGRPPVDLNAASRAVLVALCQDLSGMTWQNPGSPVAYRVDAALAGAIAGRMLVRRASRPFESWGDFSAFCDSLVDDGTIRGMAGPTETMGCGNLSVADLLKANFDPNTDLTKQMPDQLLWRWIDKSDLTRWSTEGSLGSTGSFQVRSLGRLTDSGGRLLAQRSLSAHVEGFRLLRQTSQRDFVAGRPLEAYLSRSPGGAFGYRTTGATASWKPAGWGADEGLAAITYPCAPTALPGKASRVDGYVGLATVQEGHAHPAQGPMLFLHHLDDGADADLGNPVTYQGGLPGSLSEDIWPLPTTEPNPFLPDGLHNQFARAPAFQALGNFPAATSNLLYPGASFNRGVISYWVKATAGQTSEAVTHFGSYRLTGNFNAPAQCLQIGLGDFSNGRWGICLEHWAQSEDSTHERQSGMTYTGNALAALKGGCRWRLVTAWFDTDETTVGQDVRFSLRGIPAAADSGACGYAAPYTAASSENLFAPGVKFWLGHGKWASTTNQVMDEVAICDFGDAGASTGVLADRYADNRYADGRYYKGDDARFLSAVLEPLPGQAVRLLSARWTEYLPREKRQELLVTPGNNPAMPEVGTPRALDLRLASSRLDLSLLEENGDFGSAPLQALVQGAALDRSLRRFRYRVGFFNGIGDPVHDGVLETPFLDDITFVWQAASGPRWSFWEDR